MHPWRSTRSFATSNRCGMPVRKRLRTGSISRPSTLSCGPVKPASLKYAVPPDAGPSQRRREDDIVQLAPNARSIHENAGGAMEQDHQPTRQPDSRDGCPAVSRHGDKRADQKRARNQVWNPTPVQRKPTSYWSSYRIMSDSESRSQFYCTFSESFVCTFVTLRLVSSSDCIELAFFRELASTIFTRASVSSSH